MIYFYVSIYNIMKISNILILEFIFSTNYAIYIANHDIYEAVFSDNKMKINLTLENIARPTYFDVGLFDI